MEENNNIYPIFDRMLTRQDKEELLKQRGVMIWFTGLSGSGKSTIAIALERELHKRGLLCRILDGDNIRTGINNNLGFSGKVFYFSPTSFGIQSLYVPLFTFGERSADKYFQKVIRSDNAGSHLTDIFVRADESSN